MVEDHGIGLIALSDRIIQAEIQSLLGLKYIGSWESNAEMETGWGAFYYRRDSHLLSRQMKLREIFFMDRISSGTG